MESICKIVGLEITHHFAPPRFRCRVSDGQRGISKRLNLYTNDVANYARHPEWRALNHRNFSHPQLGWRWFSLAFPPQSVPHRSFYNKHHRNPTTEQNKQRHNSRNDVKNRATHSVRRVLADPLGTIWKKKKPFILTFHLMAKFWPAKESPQPQSTSIKRSDSLLMAFPPLSPHVERNKT